MAAFAKPEPLALATSPDSGRPDAGARHGLKYRTPTTSHVVPGPSRNSPVTGWSLTTLAPRIAGLSISGTVTGPDAAPVEGMKVLAYGLTTAQEATTAADGTYAVDVVAGTYYLYVYDPAGAHPSGYYSAGGFTTDYHEASLVVVGVSKSGIDVQLPAPLWITGTVTAAGGGGIGHIAVAAYSSALNTGTQTETADDGSYALAVTPGTYEVGFSDPGGFYASGFFGATGYTANEGSASQVLVTASDVSGTDVELPVGIHLKGIVTSPAGAPLQDIVVIAFGTSNRGIITEGTTAADGSYSLVVTPDSYVVAFVDESGTYPIGYYRTTGFTADGTTATKVVVTAADVLGISIKYPAPIYLRGTATGPGAIALAGIIVSASGAETYDGAAMTAADGTWSIPVVADSYRLRLSDPAQDHADGYYSATGYQWDSAKAGVVTVTTATIAGLNVQLPAVAHLQGVVTGPDDAPAPDILVTGFGPTGRSYTVTAPDGTYSLPAWHGTYHVGVSDPANQYVSGYYATGGFTVDSNAASPIPVVATDVTGINVKLPKPVFIRGTVTGPGATPLKGIDVDATSLAYEAATRTAADGTFAISVAAGTYHVSFCDEEGVYGGGYYGVSGFTIDPNAALPVVVSTTDKTGIDVELPLALHIKGTVTGAGGVPLAGIDVSVQNDTAWIDTFTGPDGTYSVVVNPGSYFISYFDELMAYEPGYYGTGGFTADPYSATAVPVTDADVTGVDVELPLYVLPTAHMPALPAWIASPSIALHWSATAGSLPVFGYDVRYRRAPWNGGFGSFVMWKSETPSTKATFTAAAGYTYCFSARAVDEYESVSPWTSETCTAVPLDDRSLTRGSGWTARTGSGYYRSTYLQATTRGAKLTRTKVSGQRIAIVATTCPTCGSIDVYWGATRIKTISLKSATTVNRKLITVVVWSAPRTGTLTIKVATSGRKVIIDGVAIRRN